MSESYTIETRAWIVEAFKINTDGRCPMKCCLDFHLSYLLQAAQPFEQVLAFTRPKSFFPIFVIIGLSSCHFYHHLLGFFILPPAFTRVTVFSAFRPDLGRYDASKGA